MQLVFELHELLIFGRVLLSVGLGFRLEVGEFFFVTAFLDVVVSALQLVDLILQIGGLWIVDKVGRRRLTLIMTPGAALSMIVLGAFFVTDNAGKDSTPYIIACLIAFMAFTAGGIQLMGWLVGSEIYPLAARSAGTSLQSASLWSTNLLITLTLLSMMELFGVGQVFWIYAGFNVAAWLFVYAKLPEITGHSLDETKKILETYMPRTTGQAARAIAMSHERSAPRAARKPAGPAAG